MRDPGDAGQAGHRRAESPGTGSAAVPLCRTEDLTERGRAVVFDVLHFHEPVRAFVLRFEGVPVAYLNRCVHVPAEMDWQRGEFLDADRRFIICSIHGAVYRPASGRCAGGPCRRGALTALRVDERHGHVCWYPSPDTRPAA